MSNYQKNKQLSKTVNVGTTKTDQSGAPSTDINVIMRNHAIHGNAPGSPKPPIYGDFSEIPDNLRDMIELGKNISAHQAALPPGLRDMTVAELINSQPADLQRRIDTERTYIERHNRLPQHLKSLSKSDILQLNDKEFGDMIAPRNPEIPPAPKLETK